MLFRLIQACPPAPICMSGNNSDKNVQKTSGLIDAYTNKENCSNHPMFDSFFNIMLQANRTSRVKAKQLTSGGVHPMCGVYDFHIIFLFARNREKIKISLAIFPL